MRDSSLVLVSMSVQVDASAWSARSAQLCGAMPAMHAPQSARVHRGRGRVSPTATPRPVPVAHRAKQRHRCGIAGNRSVGVRLSSGALDQSRADQSTGRTGFLFECSANQSQSQLDFRLLSTL